MSVSTYALTDVNTMLSALGGGDVSAMTIYHDQSSSATAATVALSTDTLSLIITGGANAGTTSIDLTNASYDTLTELVTYINGLSKGWVAAMASASNPATASTLLENLTTTTAYGVANTVTLRGQSLARIELAIDAATAALENYWGRQILSRTYSEWYDGTNTRDLCLRQFPVTALTRVCVGREDAIQIKFGGTGTHAYVSLLSNTLTLTSINAASSTSNTISVATGTITTMAASIAAVSGWSTTIYGTYGGHPAGDIAETFNLWALSPDAATLQLPSTPLSAYLYDAKAGILSGAYFCRGIRNIFVQYTAGFTSTSIEAIQAKQLCTELAFILYSSQRTNGELSSERLGDYSYTRSTGESTWWSHRKTMLNQLRRWDVGSV